MTAMHTPTRRHAGLVSFLRSVRPAALGASLLAAPVGIAAAETVDLAPSLEVGDDWRYQYRIESEMDITLAGAEHEMDMAKEAVVRLRVVGQDDDGATVELVHERIRLDVTGEVPGRFDSTTPAHDDGDDDLYAKVLRPLVGATLTLELEPSGHVRAVRGIRDAAPDGLVEAQLFRTLFGEDELIRMYEPIFTLRPKGAGAEVDVGDRWEITRRDASGLGVTEDTILLELERVRRDDAHIRIEGERAIPGDAATSLTIDGSEIEGDAVWDLGEGALRELSTTSTTRFAPALEGQGAGLRGEARAVTRLRRLDSAGR